jgi:hypothetical protein
MPTEFLHLGRNSVHTGGVHESGQLPSRVSVRWLAARWVLVGAVLSGVFAMHVLSAHQAGGGHGMVLDGQQLATGTSVTEHGGTMTMSMPAAKSTPAEAEFGAGVLMPTMPGGSMGSMATCILFLVVGAATVLLALLTSGSARTSMLTQRLFAGLLDLSPRGPPGSGPPRISLCVLRV